MKKNKKWIRAAAMLAVAGAGVGTILYFAVSNPGPFHGRVLEQDGLVPLPNIRVTDGRNVVKTDANGQFHLKGYRKTRFITVTVPAGYTSETYYISAEKGTESYDFVLERNAETAEKAHSYLQIADTEIGKDGTGPWLNAVKDLVKETKPAFLVHTGDICYEDGLKRHIVDMNDDTMGCTVRYVMGNHDYVKGKYGEELYESLYGPVWYSFDVGDVHYVILPFQNGDYLSGYSKNDRWRWLENDLAQMEPGQKLAVFMHDAPPKDFIISYGGHTIDLKAYNLISWAFGHYHYNVVREEGGVLSISTARPDCGGIDQSASGTRQIFVDAEGKVSTQMHYYDFIKPAAPQGETWSTQLQGQVLFCDSLLAGGRVYTATVDDDFPRDCGVYCLNEADGSIVWKYQAKNSVKNKLLHVDGTIIAQDCDGNVSCLRADTGALVWEKKVDISSTLATAIGICSDGETVFTGGAGNVTALRVQDGEERWRYKHQNCENSACEFVLAGDSLIVGANWNTLYALDKNTGKELWKNGSDGLSFRNTTPAVLEDGSLFIPQSDALFFVDGKSGDLLNRTQLKEHNFASSAQPLLLDGVAYVPTATKGVVAIDLQTKQILWNRPVRKALAFTAPYVGGEAQTVESGIVADGGRLIFGASDGYVYTLNRADGTVLREQFVGAPILGAAALGEDAVYVADFAGRVTKLPK